MISSIYHQCVVVLENLVSRVRLFFQDERKMKRAQLLSDCLSSSKKPTRALTLELWKTLDVEQFRLYKPAVGMLIQLPLLMPTVREYQQFLTKVIVDIKNGDIVNGEVIAKLTPVPNSLDGFLIVDGFYTDPYTEISRFVELVTEFLTIMEGADTAEYGADEYNGRVLNKFLINLKAIGICLQGYN